MYNEDNPGPGKYEAVHLQTIQNTAPNYTFRLKNPNQFKLDKMIVSPGPGNYDVKWKITKTSFPAYPMGQKISKKGKVENLVPGPGYYSLRKETNDFEVGSYK